jgi:hypothetical protein
VQKRGDDLSPGYESVLFTLVLSVYKTFFAVWDLHDSGRVGDRIASYLRKVLDMRAPYFLPSTEARCPAPDVRSPPTSCELVISAPQLTPCPGPIHRVQGSGLQLDMEFFGCKCHLSQSDGPLGIEERRWWFDIPTKSNVSDV